jgi:methionine synthase II (cobalamin-independent)
MDNTDLDRLDALHEKSTQGNRTVSDHQGLCTAIVLSKDVPFVGRFLNRPDAEFDVEIHNDFPALSRELRELRAENEKYLGVIQRANNTARRRGAENARLREVLKGLRDWADSLAVTQDSGFGPLFDAGISAAFDMVKKHIAAATVELEKS